MEQMEQMADASVRGISIWLAGKGLCDFSSSGVVCCSLLSDLVI